MNSSRPPCARAGHNGSTGVDVADMVKTAVTEVLELDPADFDWQRSLAEMGCDSINVIDLQFKLEQDLHVRDLGLAGTLDFDPLRAPLARLEQHVCSVLGRG